MMNTQLDEDGWEIYDPSSLEDVVPKNKISKKGTPSEEDIELIDLDSDDGSSWNKQPGEYLSVPTKSSNKYTSDALNNRKEFWKVSIFEGHSSSTTNLSSNVGNVTKLTNTESTKHKSNKNPAIASSSSTLVQISPKSNFSGSRMDTKKLKDKSFNARDISSMSIVDSRLELLDPNPDVHELFQKFNDDYFWGHLGFVTVDWSNKLTRCAGICTFSYNSKRSFDGRLRTTLNCNIKLSKPLLSLRSRKDMVETLLHEMIHAYLFLTTTGKNRDRDAHGPEFQSHMKRINSLTGTNITIYHSFHAEVDHYQVHWWQCTGKCRHKAPYFGLVKRSVNRAPGPADAWYKSHQEQCNGVFIKVREPPNTNKPGNKLRTAASSASSSSSI